jgi:hypothetical protein
MAKLHSLSATGLGDHLASVPNPISAPRQARVLEHYFGLLLGATLTCCPDLTDLGATLVETRPTWLC